MAFWIKKGKQIPLFMIFITLVPSVIHLKFSQTI